MKFGAVLPIWRLTTADAERLTLKAEEAGWDGVFVPDHILAKPATTQHYGPSWPDPFSLLSFLAGRTKRIQVGASVIVLPYRNPLVAAKAAATVDQVWGGRFILGIGVGWDEAEFKDLNLPFKERGAQTDGPTPVLAHDDEVFQSEATHQLRRHFCVLGGGVAKALRSIGKAEAKIVERDAAETLTEPPDDVAVEKAPGGVAVAKEDRRAIALVDVMDAPGLVLEPSGLEWIQLPRWLK